MAYSANIRIRTDYRIKGNDGHYHPSPCRRDGTSAIYLQLIIDGQTKAIPLELSWPPTHFDRDVGRCLPRHPEDKACEDHNLVCQQVIGDANAVFTEFRLRRQPVTLEGFLAQFKTVHSREDFLEYYATKLVQRRQDRLICEDSFINQRSTLRTLRLFTQKLPFATLADGQFPQRFEAWLLKKGFAATTRWNHQKTVRTYMHLAQKDHIWFPDPYEGYVIHKPKKGSWRPLYQRDVQLLDAYYRTLEIGSSKRRVLQRWLFGLASCGLRISDQVRIAEDWRFHNLLIFVPHKNRKTGRRVTIELSARAQELWDDAMREREPGSRYVFSSMSGQKGNSYLHEIEEELGLSISLHNHIGRHTFATLFLEAGGQLHVLKEYMGHATINSTMVYVETTPAALHQAANQVDGMFGDRPEQPVSSASSAILPPRRFVIKR